MDSIKTFWKEGEKARERESVLAREKRRKELEREKEERKRELEREKEERKRELELDRKVLDREKEIKKAKRIAKSENKAKGNEEKVLIEDEKKEGKE